MLPTIPDYLCTRSRPDWREFLVLADRAEEQMQDAKAAYLRRIANGVRTHVRCGFILPKRGQRMWLMWPGSVELLTADTFYLAGRRWVREDIITHPRNPYKILNPEMVQDRLINVWDGTDTKGGVERVRYYLLALGEQI